MMSEKQLEIELSPPTVMREVLTPETFTERMAAIEAEGGKVEMMEVGKTNSQWIITWRKRKQ